MIRAAYDVSSIAPPPGGTWVITGIGRVIEEQLAHLRNNRLLDFAVVGGYGGDWNPIITSMSVERWAQATASDLSHCGGASISSCLRENRLGCQ